MDSEEPHKAKKIKQLRLRFKKETPLNKYINPYQLLIELNRLVKDRYDMQFIYIKYHETKNKEQKFLNEKPPNETSLQINMDCNNVFSPIFGDEANQFLRDFLFAGAERLQPPQDFDCENYEKELTMQEKTEEMEALNKIQSKVKGIMAVHNTTVKEKIRSIEMFKYAQPSREIADTACEVYAKVLINEVVYEKVRDDSKKKESTLELKVKDMTLYVHLNEGSSHEELIEKIHPESRITSWSLSTLYKVKDKVSPEDLEGKNGTYKQYFVPYFGTDDLLKKASENNPSVKTIPSSISFNQYRQSTESFSITSYLWDQTVMKMTISLGQIDKIEKYDKGNHHQYYFHLKYPPKYYVTELKKNEAYSEKYLKFSDRVTNFVFVQNTEIESNYFLRYYLFNNTIVKVTISITDKEELGLRGSYEPESQAFRKIEKLYTMFEGTIVSGSRAEPYQQKYSLKFIKKDMDFDSFKRQDKKHLPMEIKDKFWIIKYLILVLVRHNYIVPNANELGQIMNTIEDDKNLEHIDCYIYVLWQTATSMWGYTEQKKRFWEYFKEEAQQQKKMDSKNVVKRIFEERDAIVYIFRVSLTPSGYLFNAPSPQMKGRLLKQFDKYSEFFLRVSLNEESGVELKNQKYITRIFFRQRMNELKILNRAYEPLGWSPSQLRSFSLWYMHPIEGRNYQNGSIPRLSRTDVLNFLGDFRDITIPAKRAARIGQSFSSSWNYDARNIKYKQIEDIKSSVGLDFTDGIGKISEDLLEDISLKLSIRNISVIQVRFLGAKGVLVLDPELKKSTVHLRKSMIKYKCDDENARKYLDILDWNKYKAGFLNRQVIILLRTLGIKDDIFTQLQYDHIKRISNMTFKDCSVFKHLGEDLNKEISNIEPANDIILDLLKANFQLEKQPFFKGVLETLKKNGFYQLKAKSNIHVESSARLIGIIDEQGILEEDEVYCSVYDMHDTLKPLKLIVSSHKAIITRNPCLDPADIRVVRCVGEAQIQQRCDKLGKPNKFKDLWNVVIMPIKGKYPLTAQISGSDLDGDNFFICWDERLIPQKPFEPNLIDDPNAKKPNASGRNMGSQKDQYEEMLDFFIDYTNYEKLGQIDNSHLVHADMDENNFANNDKCRRLAKIHGKAVDFPKTGYCPNVDSELFVSRYPDFMEKENDVSYMSRSILGKLYHQVKDEIQSLLKDKINVGVGEFDQDLLHGYCFEETDQQITECLRILLQYEREITNLISLIRVDTEYEIYTGNFATVKDKIKQFGKNRLIATILSIRQRFFDLFFSEMGEDASRYRSIGFEFEHLSKPGFFSENAFKRAQLFYLITYTLRFPEIKEERPEYVKLKARILDRLQKLLTISRLDKYCGFVWFIIPKVIINIKITAAAARDKKALQLQAEDTHIDQQEEETFI